MSKLAATRDASWLNRPNVYGPKKYHAMTDAGTACCSGFPLYEVGALPIDEIHEESRCNRPACKKEFEKQNG